MVAYTAFPFKASDVAPVFVAIKQDSDTAAIAEALRHLQNHSSATRVTLWREDKAIFHGLSREGVIGSLEGNTRKPAAPPFLPKGRLSADLSTMNPCRPRHEEPAVRPQTALPATSSPLILPTPGSRGGRSSGL